MSKRIIYRCNSCNRHCKIEIESFWNFGAKEQTLLCPDNFVSQGKSAPIIPVPKWVKVKLVEIEC